MNVRKTKIVCTLGPACDDDNTLRAMMREGMDVARINFSHGNHEEQARRIARVKALREEMGLPVALLADTKGPEVRLGVIEGGKCTLVDGQELILTTKEVAGDAKRVSVSYPGLTRDVRRGAQVLIDDGLIEMTAESVTDTEITCRVIHGGVISSRKGVNVPDTRLSMPYISSQDRCDMKFIADNDFDFVAASFTRCARDIRQVREELARLGARDIRVIAKIENGEGVDNIDAIIDEADAIMVARGDMGVEIPYEEIPILQKRLIRKAYTAGMPAITATQLLESMVHNPRPTRAETTDVANAIYDGTSAIMLSGETAAGQFPVEAVRAMARIALRTEREIDYGARFRQLPQDMDMHSITNAISHATCSAAHDLGAACVITVTKSGATARMISKFRPGCPILGCSPSPRVMRQLNLSWGVTPLPIAEETDTDRLLDTAVAVAQSGGLAQPGDIVVLTAGVPLGQSGNTNMLRVGVVGENLSRKA